MMSFVQSLLAFVVALGVLVFVHELGHFLVAKRLGVKVLRFSIGFGPILWSRQRGETEYAVSVMPLGGYVKMLGEEDEAEAEAEPERAFSKQSAGRRGLIVFAGPAMNLVFAFLVYAALFAVAGVETTSSRARIGGTLPGAPAAAAGLQAGDEIVSIDGRPLHTWDELSQTVLDSKGARLSLTVDRDGRRFTVEVTPELKPNRSVFGEHLGQVYRIGVEVAHEWMPVRPVAAVGLAAAQTWTASAVVVKGLALMVTGQVPLAELGGPIAIARAAGQQARAGLRYFVGTLAFLSVNLGVLNLLPIPALDGGHLALSGVEVILRRPLRRRHRELAQQVGLLLLLTLMAFVFYNDIHRLVLG